MPHNGDILPLDTLDRATLGQAAGFGYVAKVWRAFEEAEHELTTEIGVLVCVENCGLACTANTPTALKIEVKRAASHVLGLPFAERDKILDRIENWLLAPTMEVGPPIPPEYARTVRVANPVRGRRPPTEVPMAQVGAVLMGRCPMLDEQLRCSVYEARPFACRAYGVTRQTGPFCKRPKGLGETDTHRKVVVGRKSLEAKALIALMRETLKQYPGMLHTMFFATGVYMECRPKRMQEILPHVATAKLNYSSRAGDDPAILFQDQADAYAARVYAREAMQRQKQEEGVA